MNSVTLRLLIAFLLVLILTIIPLPGVVAGFRPPWVLLLILYLQFYMPDYFHLVVLFLLGLILDVLLSTVIGEHAFALSLVSWIASTKARRFYFFSIGQQMALIGFFALFYQILLLTIDAFLGFYVTFISVVGTAVISIALWPWIRLIAEDALLANIRNSHSR